jgi:hypothetical protein
MALRKEEIAQDLALRNKVIYDMTEGYSPVRVIHEPTVCKRKMGIYLSYDGKTWTDTFFCPLCGCEKRYNLNFLGSKQLVCDGNGKFEKKNR